MCSADQHRLALCVAGAALGDLAELAPTRRSRRGIIAGVASLLVDPIEHMFV
jgi:hypothetical protein